MMRQSTVTALAVLVAAASFRAVHLRGVTRAARRFLQRREDEVVRPMTLRARRPLMKRAIRLCLHVALAAGERLHGYVVRIRMGIVAANARRATSTRMINVDVFVAIGASKWRGTANIVRRVAARTILMRAGMRRAQNLHRRVTGAAGLHSLRREIVGLVTGRAFAVAARENGALRNVRRLLAEVAIPTARLGDCGFGVRMRMTRRADSDWVAFSLLAVSRVDVLVALGASERHRLRLFVHAMALHAGRGAVHGDGRRVAERLRMAANAVGRGGNGARLRVWRSLRGEPALRERMAELAVAVRRWSEHRARRRSAVLEARLLFVAGRASFERNRADTAARRELVALGASDSLLADVHLVALHQARHGPILWHREIRGRATRLYVLFVIGPSPASAEQRRCEQREHQQPKATGSARALKHRVLHHRR